jgi:tetratricopeptide (TPR) repeat protein
MSEHNHEQTSDIRSELRLIRDQVDLLQTSTSEPKRPWYREAATVISVVALLVSAASAIFTEMGQKAEEVRAKKEELRTALTKVIELREDFTNRVVSMTDPRMQEAAGALINSKRQIYLQSAAAAGHDIADHMHSSEYNVLAWESLYDSNFAQAEQYFKKAVDAARSDLDQIISRRSLAVFYYNPGPKLDLEQGRAQFEKAAQVLKKPTDAYSMYTQGLTYEQWGLAELRHGFRTEGEHKIGQARKYYNDLPDDYPPKKSLLMLLNDRVSQAGLGRLQPIAVPGKTTASQ